jgi:hypothetical protein
VSVDKKVTHIKKKAGDGMEKFRKMILEKNDKKTNCCV